MGKELEFKLAAANDTVLDCLLGDPETAARMEGPIVRTPMETTYFDTETNAFRTNHWTLRRRQEGSRQRRLRQDAPAGAGSPPANGRSRPGRWTTPPSNGCWTSARRGSCCSSTAKRRCAPCAARGSCAAASCSVWQTAAAPSWRATAACCTAKRRSFRLPEVELESKEGAPDAAKALADRLAKQYNLRWEPLSKFARANALK